MNVQFEIKVLIYFKDKLETISVILKNYSQNISFLFNLYFLLEYIFFTMIKRD